MVLVPILRKSTHSHSARHLSDDYIWDSLSLLLSNRREKSATFNQNANMQTAVSTDSSSGLPLLADHPTRQKLTQVEILERSEIVPLSAPLPPSSTAVSPPQSSCKDQLKLRLHMESQDLKIKRLQLELQWAQLKLASNTVKTSKSD